VTTGVELFVAAFLASVFGSMVGLGGGFILVPVLRLFFGLPPAEAAGTALVLVVANSGSGATTYLLQKRVHVRVGLTLALAGWPGSIIGAILFGIGGGAVLVPTLLYFSDLPAHAISATSHFGIVLTSPVGLITHAFQHDILVRDIIPLVIGGLLGGPIGARLSLRLRSRQLLVFVAFALAIGAISLVLHHV
jgi:uncharacterized membrane protein YfcA